MYGPLLYGRCGCGTSVASHDPRLLGFIQAVHIHDEHPEAFSEMAEEARTMITHTEEEVKNANQKEAVGVIEPSEEAVEIADKKEQKSTAGKRGQCSGPDLSAESSDAADEATEILWGLGFQSEGAVWELAVEVATRAELVHPINRAPSSIAAGATYAASLMCNEKVVQRKIAEEADVGEVTLRNAYLEILREEEGNLGRLRRGFQ